MVAAQRSTGRVSASSGIQMARSMASEACKGSLMTQTQAIERFNDAAVVCFDVDSTVITTEGIDEFAEVLGVGQAVSALTNE
jgi:hypothetical protein